MNIRLIENILFQKYEECAQEVVVQLRSLMPFSAPAGNGRFNNIWQEIQDLNQQTDNSKVGNLPVPEIVYETLTRNICRQVAGRLSETERKLLWLASIEGKEWQLSDGDEPVYSLADVANEIFRIVMNRAVELSSGAEERTICPGTDDVFDDENREGDSDEEEIDADWMQSAEGMIRAGDYAGAEDLLDGVVSAKPDHWQPLKETATGIQGYFWDQEEFQAYSDYWCRENPAADRIVYWINCNSYSKAWYWLAHIAVENEVPDGALYCLERGLEIEPDHPLLLCEKGMILRQLKRLEESLEAYTKALEREWITSSQKALALRGAATTLIDLQDFGSAEALLRQALTIEPDSRTGLSELALICASRMGLRPDLPVVSSADPLSEERAHFNRAVIALHD